MDSERDIDGEDFAVLAEPAAAAATDAVYGDDDDFLGSETQAGQDSHDPLLPDRVASDEGELAAAMHVVDERVMGYLSEDEEAFDGDEIAHDDGTVGMFLDDQEVEDALRHVEVDDET